MTFADRMAQPTSGFDYMRLGLAVAIACWHSFTVCLPGPAPGQVNSAAVDAWWDHLRPAVGVLLPMFFTLSGFLVAGSLDRTRLDGFVSLRVARILPALGVEVLLSALVLGPLLTTVPLREYFTSPTFFAYFQNMAGVIHYQLPGVFLKNNAPGIVNMSLWTVPFELECYLTLVGLAALGLYRRRWAFLVVAIVASLYVPLVLDRYATFHDTNQYSGRMLVVCFLAGVTLHLFRDRIPHNVVLFAAAATVAVLFMSDQTIDVLAVWPLAYVTVYLGLLTPKKAPVIFSGDYSYGLYLFAWPIQQAAWLTPIGKIWTANFALTLIFAGAYAAFSWHCIEKPVLSRKKAIVNAVQGVTDRVLAFGRLFKPRAA